MSTAEKGFSLSAFLSELALAWQKLAIYHSGHPEREQAVGRAHAVLVGLIAPVGTLPLGVSRDAIIGPEEKLTTRAAVRLAISLYLREVAVIRFDEGIEQVELEHLLCLLPRGGTISEGPSLSEELAALGVRNVRVETVDFTALVATDSLDGVGTGGRQGSLWDRILQRLLNDERLAVVGEVLDAADDRSPRGLLTELGTLIQRYVAVDPSPSEGSADQLSTSDILSALAGMMGETAGEQLLEAADPTVRRSTIRHITELLGAMPQNMRTAVLDAAVRELVQRDETSANLNSLTGAVSAAEMVGSLRRLRSEQVDFSPRVVAMVESLVVEVGPEIFRPKGLRNPDELAGELRHLFADDDVDKIGPAAAIEDRLFLELRRKIPVHARFADLEPYLETLDEDRLMADYTTTLVDLLLRPIFEEQEIEWIIGRQQENFKAILSRGRFDTAIRIIESLRQVAGSAKRTRPVREVAQRCLDSFNEPDTLAPVIDFRAEHGSAEKEQVCRFIELLGPAAIRQLLRVLGEESELSRRRQIFDLLVSLGPAVVPAAVSLLRDSRWYMTRNCLSLLRQVGEGITLEVLGKGIAHNDSRVRLETVKCLPDLAASIPREMVDSLLGDSDFKVVESAIGTFGSARIPSAVQPLVEMLRRPDPLGRQKQLRMKALQALGEIGNPRVLPEISQFFRSVFALVSAEERLAAFESLKFYPASDRDKWVRKGLWSPDKKVREICARLQAQGRGKPDGD